MRRSSRSSGARANKLAAKTTGAPAIEPLPIGEVAQRIFVIRGQRVLLDADLAKFYGETTRRPRRCQAFDAPASQALWRSTTVNPRSSTRRAMRRPASRSITIDAAVRPIAELST